LREPEFFVLLSLLDVPLDGYAIIQLTADLSWGRVRLATGTLYAALDRLTAEGYVKLLREEIVNGRARRSYGLTPRGANALEAEAEAESTEDAARLLSEPPPEAEHTSLEGEPRASSLERRCRWLLLAYPAWYRRKRAGEMLGTLLGANPPGRQWPSCREARALLLGGMRVRGWVWRLSMLWVVIGAGGAGYAFVCAGQGCTTNQCTNDEFWFPLYNGEPAVIAAVGALAAAVWLLLAVPLLVAGFVRLRGWRPRNWPRTAGWAGAWVAGCALLVAAAVTGALGADFPGWGLGWGWGELPVFAAWLALGAILSRILSTPAHSTDVPGGLRAGWRHERVPRLASGAAPILGEARHDVHGKALLPVVAGQPGQRRDRGGRGDAGCGTGSGGRPLDRGRRPRAV
jgi:DNA-binding PadR family transcriptional regulator